MCAGLVAAGGCKGTNEQEPVRLVASQQVYESDVPLPVGFSLLEKVSEYRSTGSARLYLRHTYVGGANKHGVRTFYREQMPSVGWGMVSEGNVKGEYTLRFEKGTESCSVLIRDRRRLTGGTEVQVVISQEQRGEKPPAARSQK
jgi:hypothetical protein